MQLVLFCHISNCSIEFSNSSYEICECEYFDYLAQLFIDKRRVLIIVSKTIKNIGFAILLFF